MNQTIAKLQSLHDKLTMLEAHLGVRASEEESHQSLITELGTIQFMNRKNYEKRITTKLNDFRGQLNYAYVYREIDNHVSDEMQKCYIRSILIKMIAGKLTTIMESWPRNETAVAAARVKNLSDFIKDYCKLRHAKEYIDNRVTEWFQEIPNQPFKFQWSTAWFDANTAAYD
jgi:hypothetical protein